ncbi:ATV_HP_G0139040.mRNA.1.CDS.1 [Saccharomyces cerevisiae]|nr:ATV_HP_G0139040.mRNA.1.CDS.1 [Saccharomyces cerevisiae]CAI6896794.1 ATV_HP_G0139040.mRNA.1.CDS.1 [Saccharomyces cerevisiae]
MAGIPFTTIDLPIGSGYLGNQINPNTTIPNKILFGFKPLIRLSQNSGVFIPNILLLSEILTLNGFFPKAI